MRDLPMPGSPEIKTTCPSPSAGRSSRGGSVVLTHEPTQPLATPCPSCCFHILTLRGRVSMVFEHADLVAHC